VERRGPGSGGFYYKLHGGWCLAGRPGDVVVVEVEVVEEEEEV
jgi:hypothetical protein